MPNIGKEMESPGYEFPNEIYIGLSHNKAGMIGMANAGPNTNGSEFYITLGDRSYLDGNYTLFGCVISGLETVNRIVQGDTIKSIKIERVGKGANNFIITSDSFFQMVDAAKIKLKVDEDKKATAESEKIQKNWPDANSTPSGLKYIIVKEGSGKIPEKGSVLTVQYDGSFLLSDYKFYSTAIEGKPDNTNAPEEFQYIIGTTDINPGINEMLSGMKSGEIRKVIVQSKLAYGTNAYYSKEIKGKKRFVISPNTSLIYQIKVLEVK
jgi:cyclophilin family peptidyl-prolyl cis-trans isomerase